MVYKVFEAFCVVNRSCKDISFNKILSCLKKLSGVIIQTIVYKVVISNIGKLGEKRF